MPSLLTMTGVGLGAGVLAGLFGIGGATIVVPLFLSLNFSPLQAIGTASLSIVCASASGTWQNWRTGKLNIPKIWRLAVPAVVTVQLGVVLAKLSPPLWLLLGFASYLLINAWLVELRTRFGAWQGKQGRVSLVQEITIGSLTGLLSGLFGVGGGMVLVPLQLVLLKEPVKSAICDSLAVVTLTGIVACLGHGWAGNVVWLEGILVAGAGAIGAQLGTRILPHLSDRLVTRMLQAFLGCLAVYTIHKALQ